MSKQLSCGFISFFLFAVSLNAFSEAVGDHVRLVDRDIGIPGHPGPGDRSISYRYAGNTIVTITAIDQATGWYEIDDQAGNSAWIIKKYVAGKVDTDPEPGTPGDVCYRVGAWNLEHFGFGKTRGFPENTRGGPTYAERTPAEIAQLAAAIRDELDIKILALSEINGEGGQDEDRPRSAELDALVSYLGMSYRYEIAESGNSQRVAIVYDQRYARLNAISEIYVPYTPVGNKDIFDRDPLIGHFTLLENGETRNDLVVVALHLASGQRRAANHDAAMSLLRDKLVELRSGGAIIPADEFDMILVGDLNASWYDNYHETFFDDMNTGHWHVMAADPYPATRLAHVPLRPNSLIDYMIVSTNNAGQQGLFGEEITEPVVSVHHELAEGNWEYFRQTYSDHFPITACINVTQDTDH